MARGYGATQESVEAFWDKLNQRYAQTGQQHPLPLYRASLKLYPKRGVAAVSSLGMTVVLSP